MNKFPIKEVFKIHGGNSGLTEKIIYENQSLISSDNIPVFSSASEEAFQLPKVDKNVLLSDKNIKIFLKNKSYIIIARNGKAGLMNIIENIDFTINDHAYIMELKKSFIDKVNLDFFILKYQNIFLDFVSSKDSNGTFSKEIAENFEIELISINKQKDFLAEQKKLFNLKNSLNKIYKEVDTDLTLRIKEGNPYLIRELFHHYQGHQLTDKFIYDNIGDCPVYSGADNKIKGYIDRPLFEDESKLPCLIYQTKGNNDFKSKVINELFNANNTAVLNLKESKKALVNINYIQLIFPHNMKLSISSQEGVSYIDTKILNTEVFLPTINEQNEIVNQSNKLKSLKNEINNLIIKLNIRLNEQLEII